MADQTSRKGMPEILRELNLGSPREAVDKILSATPIGPLSTAIGDSFFGINHRQTPNPVPINRDAYGYTFFTRPLLNLSTGNLRSQRHMIPLLTQEPASIPRIIRCLLDRQLAKDGVVTCPFVDNQQAFIPLLTNNLLSISGWPDVSVETFTSQAGPYKEAFSIIDDTAETNGPYDISANFRNIPGNPILFLFLNWIRYASHVYEGTMIPYPDYLVENEIDYQTRIYRIVLDYSKTRVQHIGACGVAVPASVPMGALMNYDSTQPFNQSNDQISIPMKCTGAIYYDPILIHEFNETVIFFNDTMKDGPRERMYTLVPQEALGLFNNRGYPRIEPNTYDMQWWVPNDEFRELTTVKK